MDSIKDSFKEALDSQFEKLKATTDAEAQGKIINHIDTLASHYEDEIKEEHNHEEKKARLKFEQNQSDDAIIDHRDEMTLKEKSLNEQKKARYWESGIAIGSTVINFVLTCVLTSKILNFEKEGTITSGLRNGVLGRIVKHK